MRRKKGKITKAGKLDEPLFHLSQFFSLQIAENNVLGWSAGEK